DQLWVVPHFSPDPPDVGATEVQFVAQEIVLLKLPGHRSKLVPIPPKYGDKDRQPFPPYFLELSRKRGRSGIREASRVNPASFDLYEGRLFKTFPGRRSDGFGDGGPGTILQSVQDLLK